MSFCWCRWQEDRAKGRYAIRLLVQTAFGREFSGARANKVGNIPYAYDIHTSLTVAHVAGALYKVLVRGRAMLQKYKPNLRHHSHCPENDIPLSPRSMKKVSPDQVKDSAILAGLLFLLASLATGDRALL